ncbi:MULTISPECIES: DinB family protein [Micromonospora]|uniref:DinB family protein n=1 Tax=Micromonospora TaxID=1873 RepID=UPI00131A46F7|nr:MULTISPECIES: DinB family protein [Micromonospora]NES13167.1 DinB family protein [Micromonospora sp. PPF5-17B]NES36268.1 DinB family protein [Micromonospora solifontis]NES55092.1 DinB family protein [Micromonospora sp. PPF5-6]
MERCDECLFVYSEVPGEALPALLRGLGGRFTAALGEVPDVRRRPAPGVWSPLEYTCHVRDVLRVQGERLALALRVEEPTFVPMGRDERALTERYNDQEPATVLAELGTAAQELAARFAGLGPAQLARTGVYPWPERQVRTLLWLGQHTVHEGEHHLLDIRRGGGAAATDG